MYLPSAVLQILTAAGALRSAANASSSTPRESADYPARLAPRPNQPHGALSNSAIHFYLLKSDFDATPESAAFGPAACAQARARARGSCVGRGYRASRLWAERRDTDARTTALRFAANASQSAPRELADHPAQRTPRPTQPVRCVIRLNDSFLLTKVRF
ncbi:hypothetical protein B0H15DRAFT_858477 [Mycena belliarum]|uniref:Uncharacterized protein n=1 Tax=Mycena belliarum TaxID=1033014 RepID=A0AAD6TVF2_9AGAR|nr:hypothetical protein B0H15DRAFT_858449 [Mycena belliae]KAJ7079620.1 hypothetical protein B0H15DRAFT_858463 [Mycena belliae]KAJ7079623.1 hypothetical protein B0H15DRAFT_858477 [Mycena belliae]